MSTFMLAVALIAGPPSIGLPSASTTRPRSSGPAGTSSKRPVLRTVSPSRTRVALPKMATPTMSVSRFMIWPVTTPPSESNSTSSPLMALLKPYTRAMPSPISTTCPTSEISSCWLNCSISFLMTDVISSVLIFTGVPLCSIYKSGGRKLCVRKCLVLARSAIHETIWRNGEVLSC